MDSRMSNYDGSDLDSIPDVFPNRLGNDIGVEFFQQQESVHEQIRIEHRLPEKNRQVYEHSSLVRSLTRRITSDC